MKLCLLIDVYFIIGIIDIKESFATIAEGVGVNWTKLAAFLDPHIDVDMIQESHRQISDQAMSFLNQWHDQHSDANLGQLITALEGIECNHVAESLKREKFKAFNFLDES